MPTLRELNSDASDSLDTPEMYEVFNEFLNNFAGAGVTKIANFAKAKQAKELGKFKSKMMDDISKGVDDRLAFIKANPPKYQAGTRFKTNLGNIIELRGPNPDLKKGVMNYSGKIYDKQGGVSKTTILGDILDKVVKEGKYIELKGPMK